MRKVAPRAVAEMAEEGDGVVGDLVVDMMSVFGIGYCTEFADLLELVLSFIFSLLAGTSSRLFNLRSCCVLWCSTLDTF